MKIIAVSYTHLDVYKRQAWDITIREFTRHSVIIENCCDPVSYTHLDVYKRQM